MQMKISRRQNLNVNLHLVQKCVIKTMKVLCDTALEEYSNETLVWPEDHLQSIMI